MRCPDCGKFVPTDADEDPEITSGPDVDGGQVRISVRIVNKCGECGTELQEAELEAEGSCVDEFDDHLREIAKEKLGQDAAEETIEELIEQLREKHELEATEDDVELSRTDDFRPHGRPSRYQKHYYGFEGTVTVKCSCGEFESQVEVKEDIQSGGMDELT